MLLKPLERGRNSGSAVVLKSHAPSETRILPPCPLSLFHSVVFAGLENVDGFGEVVDASGAAAELATMR